jgi:hypothetical protein
MPDSDAIMCEFPAPVDPQTSDCASPSEIADVNNLSTSEAATALATSKHSSIALDWSEDAIAACGGPRKITFVDGQFPDGSVLCLNCGTQLEAMPPVYASKDKACAAKCEDLINNGNGFKPANVAAYCDANAHTAPNFDQKICYHGLCTAGGSPPVFGFDDPRRHPEPVQWIDEHGGAVSNGTNTLTRTAMTTGNTDADFNSGAGSLEIIKSGDAWVEFEAAGANASHILGLRESCDNVLSCPDLDPGLTGIGLSLNLHENGSIYVLQGNGQPLQSFGPFPGYVLGERFRVRATDNHDKTATISFTRLTAPCVDGTVCAEDPPLYVSPVKLHYPLRVDATLREQNAAVANVTIVYIIQ